MEFLALLGLAAAGGGGWFVGTKRGKKEALEEEWAKDEGWWTVIGLWLNSQEPDRSERYMLHAQAPTWQEAEDQALHYAMTVDGKLLIAGVFAGKFRNADSAAFSDRHTKRIDYTTGMDLDGPTI